MKELIRDCIRVFFISLAMMSAATLVLCFAFKVLK